MPFEISQLVTEYFIFLWRMLLLLSPMLLLGLLLSGLIHVFISPRCPDPEMVPGRQFPRQ